FVAEHAGRGTQDSGPGTDQPIDPDDIVLHVIEILFHLADGSLELRIGLQWLGPGMFYPGVPTVVAQGGGTLDPGHGFCGFADLRVAERLAHRRPVVALRVRLE